MIEPTFLVKAGFIGFGASIPVMASPPIAIVFDGLVINGNYLLASIVGWAFGWALNRELALRQVVAGLIVAVIITLYVGEGIQSITANTFLESEKLNGFIIVILNAAGIPLWEKLIDVVRDELPERLKRWLGGDK